MPSDKIQYSDKYYDEHYEYSELAAISRDQDRHVILPPDIVKLVPKNRLMTESEWRNISVQQSPGWVHYMVHEPEPHILLFRRPLPPKPPVVQKLENNKIEVPSQG